MSDLIIPPEHQRGLQKLYALSEQSVSDLWEVLRNAAREEESESLAISKLTKISELPQTDQADIVDTIVSLYKVRASADVSTEEFVADICDFLQSSESKEFRLPQGKVGLISDRLKKFLSIDALDRAAKATILRYEHERTLCSLRILTDARPVFGNDASERPETVVIFHMLKIAYHESGDVKEIFFSLDENDLEELKRAVLRAEVKFKTMKEVLAVAHLKVITQARS